MSTREQLVLVSSYAPPGVPGIYAFGFDLASGALRPLGSYAGVASPSFLALHPDGRRLFAAAETSVGDEQPASVCALTMARAPWALADRGSQPSGGDWPCHLTIDATGRWLAVSNYGSGTARLFPIGEAGLGEPGEPLRHAGGGPNAERQEGPHAHSAIFAPDNRFLIVADLGIDRLVVYAFDAATGAATRHGEAPARPGAGPRHMAFHPSGQLLYVSNELDNTVTAYAYNPAAGALAPGEVLPTLPVATATSYVSDIHLAPAGDRLYVANRGHNSIAVFDVGAGGELAPLATRPCGGDWPRNFAIAPDGRHILVANQHSGDLSVLPLLAGPEAIGLPVARAEVPRTACVIFAGEVGDA
ncbi:MAG: lactonase family protein [Chloroflexales bacterium]